MKNPQNKVFGISRSIALLAIILALSIANNSVIAQHEHSKHSKDVKKVQKVESIERKGTINLKKIDKNKDGKLYQDPMHWNVISDSPGKCPICKMTLKEVSIKEAKENLIKNGFKVK